MGSVDLAAYQSTKWAVGGFSTVLAQEVAPFGIRVTVLEPAGMRSDWSGSSMTIPSISEPCQQTVGQLGRLPPRISELILTPADREDVPLRLLVGPEAVEYAGEAAEALAESDRKWRP